MGFKSCRRLNTKSYTYTESRNADSDRVDDDVPTSAEGGHKEGEENQEHQPDDKPQGILHVDLYIGRGDNQKYKYKLPLYIPLTCIPLIRSVIVRDWAIVRRPILDKMPVEDKKFT